MPTKDHFEALLASEINHAKHAARVREGRAAISLSQDYPELPTPALLASPVDPDEPGDNLTPAQRLAVAAIVGGETFSAAARAAGCSRKTLWTWRRQPGFRRAVETRSREAIDVVVVRVRNLMLRATRVLSDAMVDDAPGATARHAIRVVNSARLWAIVKEPAPDDLGDDEAATTIIDGPTAVASTAAAAACAPASDGSSATDGR